jgi:hypothetical protein
MTTLTPDPAAIAHPSAPIPPPPNSSERVPRWRLALWGSALLALSLPFLAMQVGNADVNWSGFDFAVFGVMLAVACGGVELAVRLSRHSHDRGRYRLAAILTIGGGFLMVWANLAVGIIGNENNPQNQLFFGILAIGVIGAILTRFSAQGLAQTLRVMAGAQLLIGLVAWALGWAFLPVFTLFYVGLWLTAAHLFRKAATYL